MKELVEVIAKALVDHPDEVVVTEEESGYGHGLVLCKNNANSLNCRRLARYWKSNC